MKPEVETAKIITLSTAHLHPSTREYIKGRKGDIIEGPSIAVREEGFLVNSHLGSEDAVESDLQYGNLNSLNNRMPDLVAIRALARGLRAAWINFDIDGDLCPEVLPSYGDDGEITLPTNDLWRAAFDGSDVLEVGEGYIPILGELTLRVIEAGQTPGLSDDMEP